MTTVTTAPENDEPPKPGALVPSRPPQALRASELRVWAEAAIESKRFRDSTSVAQAIIKMKAGAELGLPPIASMTGIHVIEGKIALSAVMMAGLIQRSGRFRYRVTRLVAEDPDPRKPGTSQEPAGCTIEFFEKVDGVWESCGVPSTFTMKDAVTAGLTNKDNWRKYRRNMLFGRALSNGARWYCASVFQGAPVYVNEELGLDTDAEGEAVNPPPPTVIDAAGEIVDANAAGAEPSAAITDPTVVFARMMELTRGDAEEDTARAVKRWGTLSRMAFGTNLQTLEGMAAFARAEPARWLDGCTMLAEQE